jgi:hypothetical protein
MLVNLFFFAVGSMSYLPAQSGRWLALAVLPSFIAGVTMLLLFSIWRAEGGGAMEPFIFALRNFCLPAAVGCALGTLTGLAARRRNGR